MPVDDDLLTDERRPLRADARHNHDRLLEAAATAFARDGADASLKAIAKEVGVGIGTLYRRFPTREDLVEAIYREETTRLCDSAAALLEAHGPVGGLRRWADRFLDYMHVKHGMADALPAILTAQEGLRVQSRQRISDAIDLFLQRGATEGSLRDDVDPAVVMMALGGTTLITEHEDDRSLGDQLLDLLLDGLVAAPGRSPGSTSRSASSSGSATPAGQPLSASHGGPST